MYVYSTGLGEPRICHNHGIYPHVFGAERRQEQRPVFLERRTQGLPAWKSLLHAIEIYKITSAIPLGIMHDTSSRCKLATVTTCSSFSFPGVTKILVPTSVTWETAILSGLEGEAEQPVTSPDIAENTLAFLYDNINAPIASWMSRDLFQVELDQDTATKPVSALG